MEVAILAALVGVALGHFFKARILFPAFIITGAIISFGAGLANRDRASSIVLALLIAAIALQLGYIVGVACLVCLSRFWMKSSNTRRQADEFLTSLKRRMLSS
jgi:ABC-type sulfate transport system permease subunit